ncbi:hypothetical protein BDK51DRAFT_52815 [Blyttiomyces helicus]|uniref:Extracellular membrane protein CFEM domain-containing protein n=1 Tax=Blyttiomyces helicus TaxID=388810 RepID=A0A4P9WIZ1_9FUNG|nr:hypothetical protein BDK51DRAFT_52815 [Blyttiomyces helicus]|eukprot:RKO91428.1 hypothetical protein BDK51DRAFT_52815 [Blyttiomyces helicus]
MYPTVKLMMMVALALSARAAPGYYDAYGAPYCPTVVTRHVHTCTTTTIYKTATETGTFEFPNIKNGILPAGTTTDVTTTTTPTEFFDTTVAPTSTDSSSPTPPLLTAPVAVVATPTATALPACAIASVAAGYTSCAVAQAHVAALNSATLIQCISIVCNPAETPAYVVRGLYQCQMLECQARIDNNGIFPTIGAGTPW